MRIGFVIIVFGLIAVGGASSGIRAAPQSQASSPADTTESVFDDPQASKKELKEEMARIGEGKGQGKQQWEQKKSPTVAMVSSMILPGLGQLYNGRKYKPAIAAGAFGYFLGSAWLYHKQSQEYLVIRDGLPEDGIPWKNADLYYEFYKDNSITYLWWAGAAWLLNVLDAYIDAHLYDVRAVTPTVTRGTDGTKYLALSVGF